MKKLITIAAVAMAAVCANASNAVWGFNGFDYLGPNGEGYNSGMGMNLYDGGKAFLFLGTVSASDTAFDFTKATYVDEATYDPNYWMYGVATETAYDQVKSTAAGQAYALLMVDDKTATWADLATFEGSYVLRNLKSEEGVNPGPPVTTYAQFQDGTAIAQSDWKTMSAVPEPTSGLLLLLGVAGLALRRRRA